MVEMEDDNVDKSLLSSHLECNKRLKNDWERICEKFMNVKDNGGIEFSINDIEEYYNDDKPVKITRIHRAVLKDCRKCPVDILLQSPPMIATSTKRCKTVLRGRLMTQTITQRTFQVTMNNESEDNTNLCDPSDVEPITEPDLNDMETPTEPVVEETKRRHKHKHRHHKHKHRHHHHRHRHTTPFIQPSWMTPMMCPLMTSCPYLPMYTPYFTPSLYSPHTTHPHTCCHTHH